MNCYHDEMEEEIGCPFYFMFDDADNRHGLPCGGGGRDRTGLHKYANGE